MQESLKDVFDDHTTNDSAGTGFEWLDSVERYVSQIAIAIRNIKNGVLIDLDAFMESGC